MAGLAALDQDTSAPLTSLYNVGLDVNALVAPPVKLTLTINPDFAQVEADQAQLNLSHHSLYLPEKRLFFIEGKDFFSFATSSGNQLFTAGASALDEEGDPLPILGGVRLLGRSGKTNVGLLTAQMSPESWRFEETRNASVLRVKQNILKRSAIGALATASTQGASVEGVAGLDLRLRTTEFATNKTLELTAAGALGWSRAAGQQGETWRLALAGRTPTGPVSSAGSGSPVTTTRLWGSLRSTASIDCGSTRIIRTPSRTPSIGCATSSSDHSMAISSSTTRPTSGAIIGSTSSRSKGSHGAVSGQNLSSCSKVIS